MAGVLGVTLLRSLDSLNRQVSGAASYYLEIDALTPANWAARWTAPTGLQ